MEGLTIFLGFEDPNILREFGRELKDGYYFPAESCRNNDDLKFKSLVLDDPRNPCLFIEVYIRIKWLGRIEKQEAWATNFMQSF